MKLKQLLFLVVVLISSSLVAQTFVEIRGGATISEHGGVIGAAVTQEVSNFTFSGVFNAYGIGGYSSYDTYDVEAGYLLGNGNVSFSPIVGVGYVNQRKYNILDDSVEFIYGGSLEVLIDNYFKVGIGYRNHNITQSVFITFKIPLTFSKTKTKRFF